MRVKQTLVDMWLGCQASSARDTGAASSLGDIRHQILVPLGEVMQRMWHSSVTAVRCVRSWSWEYQMWCDMAKTAGWQILPFKLCGGRKKAESTTTGFSHCSISPSPCLCYAHLPTETYFSRRLGDSCRTWPAKEQGISMDKRDMNHPGAPSASRSRLLTRSRESLGGKKSPRNKRAQEMFCWEMAKSCGCRFWRSKCSVYLHACTGDSVLYCF